MVLPCRLDGRGPLSVGVVTLLVMSDDLRDDGLSTESAAVDEWLTNPEFLVTGDPGRVLALLDAASGPAARLVAAVYRASAHLHGDAGAGVRRQLLALDAARYGKRELAARITAVPVEGEPAALWGVEWATGAMVDPRFRHGLTGHTDSVGAVATAVVDGRPVVISGSARPDGAGVGPGHRRPGR